MCVDHMLHCVRIYDKRVLELANNVIPVGHRNIHM